MNKKNLTFFTLQVAIHPQYNPNDFTAGHDIALINPNLNVAQTKLVSKSKICLPTKRHLSRLNRKQCVSSGYGITSNTSKHKIYIKMIKKQ